MDDSRTTVASFIGGYSESNAREGARNLLVEAAGVGAGADPLIVNDTGGHIDPEVSRIIEDEARGRGARVHVPWTGPTDDVTDISPAIQAAFETADVALFHHRMSSQMRMLDRAARWRLTCPDGTELGAIDHEMRAEDLVGPRFPPEVVTA